MINFTFETNLAEIDSTFIEQQHNCYVPSSKLIDKFGQLFRLICAERIDESSNTKITFLDQKQNELASANVPTNELTINHRWETIDRAINIACHNKLLTKDIINSVKVYIPQIGDN